MHIHPKILAPLCAGLMTVAVLPSHAQVTGSGTASSLTKARVIIDDDGNMTVGGNITGARMNEVMASARPYDTTVAGVVSANPGIIHGHAGHEKEQIATTGRVKVRAGARSAAIGAGDLLVTGDVAGAAMRSKPVEIDGRQFHQPGTIIGKALEPLEGRIGEILVLLSMQ